MRHDDDKFTVHGRGAPVTVCRGVPVVQYAPGSGTAPRARRGEPARVLTVPRGSAPQATWQGAPGTLESRYTRCRTDDLPGSLTGLSDAALSILVNRERTMRRVQADAARERDRARARADRERARERARDTARHIAKGTGRVRRP